MAKGRIESLSASDEQALIAARSEWLAVGLSTEPADRPVAETAVRDLYVVRGLKQPMIVWMDSPLGGAAAAAWLQEVFKSGEVRDQVWDQVGDQVRDQVWDQVWAQVWDQVGDQVRDQVWDQVRDQVWAQVWDQVGDQVRDQVWAQVGAQVWAQVGAQVGDQVWDQVWAQVRDQVRDQVWDQVRDQVWAQVRAQVRDQVGAALWGQHEAGWLSWANVFQEVGVEFDKQTAKSLDALSRIARSSGWWWAREGVVVLTERPLVIHRDPARRLHCEDGPALVYPDGWGVWAWHGTRVEQEIVEDPKALNANRITKEQNAELRRCYMEIYGQGRYMKEAGGELLDEVHEPPFPGLIDAKLWRLPNPDGGEPFTCVECRNSTAEPDGHYKIYNLWVHPELRPLLPDGELGQPQDLTAHNALASTYGERGVDYAPLAES